MLFQSISIFADLSVGTPSAPVFAFPYINSTEFWLQSSSSVSFAPASWVTLRSLQLLALTDAMNDTIVYSLNQTSSGTVQGINHLQVFAVDDGTKWVVVANYSIGNAFTVTRTSNESTMQFYVLFNSVLRTTTINLTKFGLNCKHFYICISRRHF